MIKMPEDCIASLSDCFANITSIEGNTSGTMAQSSEKKSNDVRDDSTLEERRKNNFSMETKYDAHHPLPRTPHMRHRAPLPVLEYREMADITRTIHLNDFKLCSIFKQFLWSDLSPKTKTHLPRSGKFIWFRAMSLKDSQDKHDWYGNVRCSINLLDLLNQDSEINMFIVDRSSFNLSSATRILLTRQKSYPRSRQLNLSDLRYGDPIVFKDGKLMFLYKDATRYSPWKGYHQTEFVFDLKNISGKKLFSMCDKQPVNHSHANVKNKHGRFLGHRCLIYNSSHMYCPSPWCQHNTKQVLEGSVVSKPATPQLFSCQCSICIDKQSKRDNKRSRENKKLDGNSKKPDSEVEQQSSTKLKSKRTRKRENKPRRIVSFKETAVKDYIMNGKVLPENKNFQQAEQCPYVEKKENGCEK